MSQVGGQQHHGVKSQQNSHGLMLADVLVTSDENHHAGHLLRHDGGGHEDTQCGGWGAGGREVQVRQELVCERECER